MKYVEMGSCDPNIQYYNREACLGIYVEDGKILLALNIERNQIEMIGGGKQSGESNEDCLSREFMEEIGARVEGMIPFADIKCYWKSEYAYMCTLAHFYVVDRVQFFDIKSIDHKIRWVSLKDAPCKVNLIYQKEAIKLLTAVLSF